MAASSESTTVFTFITVSASASPLNRPAMIRRYSWSPVFSSRLISIQYSAR